MRLREQVYGITKLIHTDEQVLLVIQSEINAYLDGQKTAEEAAKQIQSRLSLNMAEQYGCHTYKGVLQNSAKEQKHQLGPKRTWLVLLFALKL